MLRNDPRRIAPGTPRERLAEAAFTVFGLAISVPVLAYFVMIPIAIVMRLLAF